jgi:hypothetical protein
MPDGDRYRGRLRDAFDPLATALPRLTDVDQGRTVCVAQGHIVRPIAKLKVDGGPRKLR